MNRTAALVLAHDNGLNPGGVMRSKVNKCKANLSPASIRRGWRAEERSCLRWRHWRHSVRVSVGVVVNFVKPDKNTKCVWEMQLLCG